jgi:hypothetical protein
MKAKLLIATILIIGIVAFAQSKPEIQKYDSQTQLSIQQTDSVYYGCVPCCQPCSVYTTDKAGECPHCGMVLEKRTYQANAENKEGNIPANSKACKPPKAKKK